MITLTSVARKYGVTLTTVKRWKTQAEARIGRPILPTSEDKLCKYYTVEDIEHVTLGRVPNPTPTPAPTQAVPVTAYVTDPVSVEVVQNTDALPSYLAPIRPQALANTNSQELTQFAGTVVEVLERTTRALELLTVQNSGDAQQNLEVLATLQTKTRELEQAKHRKELAELRQQITQDLLGRSIQTLQTLGNA